MPYSSSLTDEEWIILEPLLAQILPSKKQTRPPNWTKREILDGIFYQLKNGCNWEDLPCISASLLDGILALYQIRLNARSKTSIC
ncbi:MAG: transposase [Spirirestis rafaelensis WJT71-NPBG6]|nr:transposase [Spirirestis rafaelensis WJT71-NPBG6]